MSLKLTQLGPRRRPRQMSVDNLRKILAACNRCGCFVRLDMESSKYTDVTLEIFDTVWTLMAAGTSASSCNPACTGPTRTSSASTRSARRIRLVKGAYREPKTVAYQQKSDVARRIRASRGAPADRRHPIPPSQHKMRSDHRRTSSAWPPTHPQSPRDRLRVPDALRHPPRSAEGPARRRVPDADLRAFRVEWFPYFMRRLGERPANVAFVLNEGAGGGEVTHNCQILD